MFHKMERMSIRVNFLEKIGWSLLSPTMLMGCLIIILNGAQVAMAQWTSHGPYGRTVTAFAIDPQTPTTLYAGTGTGVFKSADGGANWNSCNNGITYHEIHALALDSKNPSTIYAGTQYGIYKSTDGGNSWNPTNYGLMMPTSVELIAIDPQTPSTLYITSGGLYKSADGGQSWALLTVVAGAQSIVGSLVIDPQHPSTIYVGTRSGSENTLGSVYKSTDGGASWTPSNNGITGWSIGCMAINFQVPTTIYAVSGGVYKSTDGAANWKLTQNIPPQEVFVLAIDPTNPAIIYAGCYPKGVYKSSDGGESWNPADNGMANSFVRALAIDPNSPDIIFAGTEND